MIFISASQLVKNSAAGICYNRLNAKIPVISDQMLKGEEFARERYTSHLIEMGGIVYINKVKIAFSIDEVIAKEDHFKCIEYKSLITEDAGWYFESSLIQSAFYFVLISNVESLTTSAFVKTDERYTIGLDRSVRYYLNFQDDIYEISLKYPLELLSFYYRKALASISYDKGRAWDKLYKHKEYPLLKHYFNYRKIN